MWCEISKKLVPLVLPIDIVEFRIVGRKLVALEWRNALMLKCNKVPLDEWMILRRDRRGVAKPGKEESQKRLFDLSLAHYLMNEGLIKDEKVSRRNLDRDSVRLAPVPFVPRKGLEATLLGEELWHE